jgi:F-type H+-transporting ATPase subunit alpha
MKKVSGTLKITLAQYRSMAAFAMFASDLDSATKAQLTRGERLMELLKQPQANPYPIEDQVASIWMGTNGYLDDIPVEDVARFEHGMLEYLRNRSDVLQKIKETGQLSDDVVEGLKKGVGDYLESFMSSEGLKPDADVDGEVEAEHTQEQIVRGKKA